MILVTGATGFVGRHMVAALQQRGEEKVRCMVHRPEQVPVLSDSQVELVPVDVLDPATLKKAVDGVRAVVHLVAIIREDRKRGGGRSERLSIRAPRTSSMPVKRQGLSTSFT